MQDPFGQKRSRCPNWTEQEKILLIKNIKARKDILFGKPKGPDNTAAKDESITAWQEVLHAINSESQFPRTMEQVKKQYENLKMRGKQVYLDMLSCKGRVKPHILSPAMKLMIDEIKESNKSAESSPSLQVWVTQNTRLPLPPLSIPATLPTTAIKEENTLPASKDVPQQGNSNAITTAGIMRSPSQSSSMNGSMLVPEDDDLDDPAAKRMRMDEIEDGPSLMVLERERIMAETEKFRAETELTYQRKEYEHAIFVMKRQLLEAKLEYYNHQNRKNLDSDTKQSLNHSLHHDHPDDEQCDSD